MSDTPRFRAPELTGLRFGATSLLVSAMCVVLLSLCLYAISQRTWLDALTRKVLSSHDGLAEEYIEEPAPSMYYVGDHLIDITEDIHMAEVAQNMCKPRPVVVENCRRVRRDDDYMACVVQEAKNRFGVPENNNANKLAVRRFLLDIMTKHGVRPTHIHRVLPLCVNLVFVRSDSELTADEVMGTLEVAIRGGGRGAWSWCMKMLYAASTGTQDRSSLSARA